MECRFSLALPLLIVFTHACYDSISRRCNNDQQEVSKATPLFFTNRTYLLQRPLHLNSVSTSLASDRVVARALSCFLHYMVPDLL
jgi:hypothetical protein